MFYGFQRLSKHVPLSFKNDGLDQYYLLNNIILLINIDKFNPNTILIDINNLKPCRFTEVQTL